MVLRDVCEGRKSSGGQKRGRVWGGGGERRGGSRELGRARAFLDLAEGVSLDLEILLHLADGRRGRRRRHGLPRLPRLRPPPPASGRTGRVGRGLGFRSSPA